MKLAKTGSAETYDRWILSIKERVQRARYKALMMANAEQVLLYWDIGHEILEKQDAEGWGSRIVARMSSDLKEAFPDMKGWSRSNLMYMRQFASVWSREEIVQAQLGQLPWYHHITLLERLKSRGDRIAYAALSVENGWSRNVMVYQIDMKVAVRGVLVRFTLWRRKSGSCKFLQETPVVRPEFNSDGCCSRYRSVASRIPTISMAISHRNVQDGICDSGGYDMLCIQFKNHLPPSPWKANEPREALTIRRSGSESNTARSFLHHPGRLLH